MLKPKDSCDDALRYLKTLLKVGLGIFFLQYCKEIFVNSPTLSIESTAVAPVFVVAGDPSPNRETPSMTSLLSAEVWCLILDLFWTVFRFFNRLSSKAAHSPL